MIRKVRFQCTGNEPGAAPGSRSNLQESERELRALDENQVSLLRYLLVGDERYIRDESWFSWSVSATPVWGNSVFRLRLSDPEAVTALKKAIRSGEAPNYVRTGPADLPRPIEPFLQSHGFQKKVSLSGMVLAAPEYRYTPKITDPGFRVLTAEGELLKPWASLVVRILFGNSSGEAASDFARLIGAGIPGGRLTCFLAFQDDVPAGASAVFLDEGSAGVYFVAVEETFRKRGFGYELTAAAVQKALGQRSTAVILHATASGKPVYEKLGFREIAGLCRWELSPDGQ